MPFPAASPAKFSITEFLVETQAIPYSKLNQSTKMQSTLHT